MSSSLAGRALVFISGAALAVGLLGLTFGNVDLKRAVGLMGELRIALPMLALPALLAIAFETLAWQATLAWMGCRCALGPLLRVRMMSEAIGAVLPFGAVAADAVRPFMLARHCNVPTAIGLASVGARKYLLMSSQAAYLARFRGRKERAPLGLRACSS